MKITDTRKQSEQLRTLVEENLETAFKREAESIQTSDRRKGEADSVP